MKLDTKARLVTKEYRTISQIKGPLLFIERIADIAYDEIVIIRDPDIAALYLQEFARVQSIASPPDAADMKCN